MDEILKFISGEGEGSGSGKGSGWGEGSGSGSGWGEGSGSGSGWGDGWGWGLGDGWGKGKVWGDGWGWGSGDGWGWGDGSGSGKGSGSGSGSGWGEGDGSGKGSGSGWGVKILSVHSFPVTYIDGIPCIVRSEHSRWAKVSVIRTYDLTLDDAFVGRYETAIAHGETIRKAIEAARNKFFSRLDFDGQKERLFAEFEKKKKLSVKELYRWHGILTGSCEYGRSLFQDEHGLKDDDELTLNEFVELTKSSYGGDVIARLAEE